MLTEAPTHTIQTAHIYKDIQIKAPIETTFEALLEELGPSAQMMDGKAFPMKIEPWPGGRWYRDLGNNSGHLWGHVQVIKPPTLLEICGPMPMSFAAINHLQYRLTAEGNGTRLKVIHRMLGDAPPEFKSHGMEAGWESKLNRVRELAERLKR